MKQVEYRKNIPPAQNVNVKCESHLQCRPHLISTKARSNSFLCLLLSLSRFLDRHFGFLWRFPLTTRSQTSVPRSPFPAPRSPLPVPRSPFPVPRSPFPVPRFSNIPSGKAKFYTNAIDSYVKPQRFGSLCRTRIVFMTLSFL